MEAAEKRKRGEDDGEVEGKKRKDEGPGTVTATEDEVEEFFAILRRMHVAANYLKRRRDGRLTAAAVTAETEDLDGEDRGVKEEVGKSGGEEDSVNVEESNRTGLDLNLEPPGKETFV